MRALFTGFDSAWSVFNSGAICNLEWDGESLCLAGEPETASWTHALQRANAPRRAELQVWAIDQPLVVPNPQGCRAVERDLARALMAEFGCGAHSANAGMLAFAADAPIWKLRQVLYERGYRQDPMAVPGVSDGLYFFECYPHPALIGLFGLNGVLKYKANHRNLDDWRTLLQLLRSIADAEFSIANIRDVVTEDLPQTKQNEDKLDALISAYIAAYWWKFGAERSSMIGDMETGYIVTPHNAPMLAAFHRVFEGRMNLAGPTDPMPPQFVIEPDTAAGATLTPETTDIPRTDWIYFATPSRWSGTVTKDFVQRNQLIVRNIYNSAGIRIANISHLKPGDRLLLVHGGKGRPYRALYACAIGSAEAPVQHSRHRFDVFTCIDNSLEEELENGGYVRDSVVGRFTGLCITDVVDLRLSTIPIPRPAGNNTLRRWEEVFGPA